MTRRAWFAGASVHTPLGADAIEALVAGRPPEDPTPVTLEYGGTTERVLYRLLPEVPLDDLERRLYRVLEVVVERALARADLSATERRDLGLFLGTSSADVSVSEARHRRELAEHGDAIALVGTNSIANLALHVRARFGLAGPDYSFNTACTSSANALMTASDMVAQGRIRAALVIGVEVFNIITAAGFQSLGLLADEAMRPFDRRRAGLTLGEGCSAMVVTADPHAGSAWYLRGSATLCDTYSMSTANPDGSTVTTVIDRALGRAGLAPDEIGALKVHGTGSHLSDEAEAAGMRASFDRVPTLCALKPHIGHTLGACGLNELLLFCRCVDAGYLPSTPGVAPHERADLGLPLTQTPEPAGDGHFMLNYFGFGGNNTSLIISNVD